MSNNSSNALQRIGDLYIDHPTIRFLIEILKAFNPILAASDVALLAALDDYREKRQRAFFDELRRGEHLLTRELIIQDDFLHAYFSTYQAAMRAKREAKVRRFARLLISGISFNELNNDKFDDFLKILDELSEQESEILLSLHEYEQLYPNQRKPLARTLETKDDREIDSEEYKEFWNSFKSVLASKLAITSEMVAYLLIRLERTALYHVRIGYWGAGQPEFLGTGNLTPLGLTQKPF